MFGVAVARPEDVEGNGEEFVVDPARIEGEDSHQEQEVAHAMHVRQYLLG